MTIHVADLCKILFRAGVEVCNAILSVQYLKRLHSKIKQRYHSRFFYLLGICTSHFTFFLISHSFVPYEEFSTCIVTLRSRESDSSSRSFACNISYNFCVSFVVLALFFNTGRQGCTYVQLFYDFYFHIVNVYGYHVKKFGIMCIVSSWTSAIS